MKLGDRMKKYEQLARTSLMPKVPVILRVDGKAFHTFTRKMERPWDSNLEECMWSAAMHLCKQIQGAQFAYVQSDEISVLILDTRKTTSSAWFDYQVQKMASVGASHATAGFNWTWIPQYMASMGEFPPVPSALPEFDGRVSNYPEHEVTNYFIWRQQDAVRNSIQMLAQAHFSHKETQGLSGGELQDKLVLEKEINWNDVPTNRRRGACIVKEAYEHTHGEQNTTRTRWVVDREIPIFTKDREYIEKYLGVPQLNR
ncbi:hypothetical protein HN588_00170 [Candidatus Bathyarchaeota archaeon]|jgi:tRNA(His) guanylyltransferase|nr:hypothetical protein [Candidatus Bathyarchaeota archaeon]